MNSDFLPPGHSSVERLTLAFPGIEGNVMSVVMPVIYGLPSVKATVMRCAVCTQWCWVSLRAEGVDMPRVCWDCIDEQVPGFVQGKLAGRG